MLADDEEHIRSGIAQKMNWNELGFELVCEAENGREALELAELHKPDVVLTDIKMPFMDGLELCSLLSTRLPAARFVVFSGFDEFEYAKAAIRMNIFEYILKPINAQELAEVLQRLHQQLTAQRDDLRNSEELRQMYEQSLPLLRQLFVTQLLDGQIQPAQIESRAMGCGLTLHGSRWLVALAQLENTEESGLVTLSVKQLFEENLRLDKGSCLCFPYNDSVALLAGLEGCSVYSFIEQLNRACKLAKSYLAITLTVGVGELCGSPGEIRRSAVGARSALEYRVLLGAGRAIYIGDLEPRQGCKLSLEEDDERALTNAIKLGSEEELHRVAGSLVERISEAGVALSQCHLYFLSLFTCLLTLARESELDIEAVFGTGFAGVVRITDFGSIAQLEEWFLRRCLNIHTMLHQKRADSTWKMIEKAKDYINGHYADSSLAVESLCDYLHLSPAYFSTLFKRETGMSFINYVTNVRMEAAADLLRSSEEKTFIIAQMVGYQDSNYFSYVFKKHFGRTPTVYRGQ